MLEDTQQVASDIAAELSAKQAAAAADPRAVADQHTFVAAEGMSEAEAFFRQDLQDRAARASAGVDTFGGADDEDLASEKQVIWEDEDWAAAAGRRQRVHATAVIAASAAKASSPLLTNKNLQVNPCWTTTVASARRQSKNSRRPQKSGHALCSVPGRQVQGRESTSRQAESGSCWMTGSVPDGCGCRWCCWPWR